MANLSDLPSSGKSLILSALCDATNSQLALSATSRDFRTAAMYSDDFFKHIYCPLGDGGKRYKVFLDQFTRNRDLACKVRRLTILPVGCTMWELVDIQAGHVGPRINLFMFTRVVGLFYKIKVLDVLAVTWTIQTLYDDVNAHLFTLPSPHTSIRELNVRLVTVSPGGEATFLDAIRWLPRLDTCRLATILYHSTDYYADPRPLRRLHVDSEPVESHIYPTFKSAIQSFAYYRGLDELSVLHSSCQEAVDLKRLLQSSAKTLRTLVLGFSDKALGTLHA